MPSSSSSFPTARRSIGPMRWSSARSKIIQEVPGVKNAVAFAGFNGATFTNASNAGVIFASFESFEERLKHGESANQIIGQLYGSLQSIQEAFIIAVPPPSVRGIGNSGGFKMQIVDRQSADMRRVLGLAYQMMGAANQTEGLTGVFTTFSASSPQYFLAIDRDKARTLERADPEHLRGTVDQSRHILCQRLQCLWPRLSGAGAGRPAVPSGARRHPGAEGPLCHRRTGAAWAHWSRFATLTGPALVQRYNMYVSVPLQGNPAPGVSTGTSLDKMEALAAQMLPQGTSFEWTELAFQERQTGNTAVFIFALSVVFVFLALAAQYESWVLPLAIILIVPLGVLSALIGVFLRGLDNNVLTQIGLIVLIGLAAKNAILIVEFARQGEDEGKTPIEAAVEASQLRLRPILMTAFAFILGVVPLMIATGPGAEMRQSLGTAVFSGMLGVTFLGLFLTPVFYVTLRSFRRRKPVAASEPMATPAE